VDQLRAKLAIIEAKLTGGPVPLSGLEILWQTALPMSRQRSTKHQCRTAWNRIPKNERPRVEVMIAALKAWNRCEEWKKDGNQYARGLHRFIAERMWEDLPEGETRDGLARYRNTPKPVPQTAPEDAATPEDIAEIFKAITPKRMNS
jgi:hypothetical protein